MTVITVCVSSLIFCFFGASAVGAGPMTAHMHGKRSPHKVRRVPDPRQPLVLNTLIVKMMHFITSKLENNESSVDQRIRMI